HRMRGASGNLALLQLHAVLGQMEHDSRNGETMAFEKQLPKLVAALANVEALLRATESVHAAPVSSAPTLAIASLSVPARTQMGEALERMACALQAGEIDGQALQHLCLLLPSADTAALQAALDIFDLDHALHCVRALAQSLPPTPHHLRNTADAAQP
ncbi:MAG: hypothetical protein RR566_06455, partial [Comamonas sp.]